jgi:hypothetical protein
MASLRAASFASLPGGTPISRFHCGGVGNAIGSPRAAKTPPQSPAEGKGAYSAFLRPWADEFDEGGSRVRLGDDLSQERRVDAAALRWPVPQHRHVEDVCELAAVPEDGDRACDADIDAEDDHQPFLPIAGGLGFSSKYSQAQLEAGS